MNKYIIWIYVCIAITLLSFIRAESITIDIPDDAVGYIDYTQNVFIIKLENLSTYQKLEVCEHEIGHSIFKGLDKSQVRSYQAIFNDAKNYSTVYASTNYEEDFAESFRGMLHTSYNYNTLLGERKFFFREFIR